jgi:hypothetical protein
MRKSSFQRVIRADSIDFDDGFKGIGRESRYRGEEVSCGSGTVPSMSA